MRGQFGVTQGQGTTGRVTTGQGTTGQSPRGRAPRDRHHGAGTTGRATTAHTVLKPRPVLCSKSCRTDPLCAREDGKCPVPFPAAFRKPASELDTFVSREDGFGNRILCHHETPPDAGSLTHVRASGLSDHETPAGDLTLFE